MLTPSTMLTAAGRYLWLRRRKGLRIRPHLRAAGRALLRSQRGPVIATVAVTGRCPLDCEHCSCGGPSDDHPPRAQLDRTLDALVECGTPVIALTGGEPLVREDLVELVDRLPAAMVYTSGVGPESRIRELATRAHATVCVSIDHSEAAEHDRRRGRPGAHAAARRTLATLAAGRCDVHVSTLVTPERLESGELRAFLRSLDGTRCVQLFGPVPIGRVQAAVPWAPEQLRDLEALTLEANADPELPLVVPLPLLEHASALGCCGGYARVHVDAHGDVRPCDFAPQVFGNVGAEPFEAIWRRVRAAHPTPGDRCLSCAQGPRRVPGAFGDYSHVGYRLLVQSLSFATEALEGRACAD